ncbi:hypothetical protein [Collimonas arenae]|nr:hypothetical protein [Collimonas arenae]
MSTITTRSKGHCRIFCVLASVALLSFTSIRIVRGSCIWSCRPWEVSSPPLAEVSMYQRERGAMESGDFVTDRDAFEKKLVKIGCPFRHVYERPKNGRGVSPASARAVAT